MTKRERREFPTPDDLWIVIKSFFQEKGLVRQHLDSYNRFVDELLGEIIRDFSTIKISENITLHIKDYRIGKPSAKFVEIGERDVTPLECRLRNLTYATPLIVRLTVTGAQISGKEKEIEIKLLDLPVMVKSKLDPLSKAPPEELINAGEDPKDPGGVFHN